MPDNNTNPLKDFKEQLLEYVDIRIELFKLSLYEKISQVIASIAASFITITLLLFMILSLFMAGGFYLSQLLHSYTKGFAVGALMYLLLLLLFSFLMKKSFKRFIINKLLRLFTNDISEE